MDYAKHHVDIFSSFHSFQDKILTKEYTYIVQFLFKEIKITILSRNS